MAVFYTSAFKSVGVDRGDLTVVLLYDDLAVLLDLTIAGLVHDFVPSLIHHADNRLQAGTVLLDVRVIQHRAITFFRKPVHSIDKGFQVVRDDEVFTVLLESLHFFGPQGCEVSVCCAPVAFAGDIFVLF